MRKSRAKTLELRSKSEIKEYRVRADCAGYDARMCCGQGAETRARAWIALEMGTARETVVKERRREGRRKRMRRSSNSCATVRSVGTLYAYMSVQARRTRSAKGGRRERVDKGKKGRGGGGSGDCRSGWCLSEKFVARETSFFRARRAFVRLLCGWEVKFVVYYRGIVRTPRRKSAPRVFDAPRRTEGVPCFCANSFAQEADSLLKRFIGLRSRAIKCLTRV